MAKNWTRPPAGPSTSRFPHPHAKLPTNPTNSIPIPQSTLLRRPHLRIIIDPHNTEALVIPIGPLKIIHQRPSEIPPHIRTPSNSSSHRPDVLSQILRPIVILNETALISLVIERRTILGNHHRNTGIVPMQPNQQLSDPLRHDLPAHRRNRNPMRHRPRHRPTMLVLGPTILIRTREPMRR